VEAPQPADKELRAPDSTGHVATTDKGQ
jgi:hypothetical protein